MKKRSVPREQQGIRTGRRNFEKDLSAKQRLQEENPRFQAPHEDQRRTPDPEEKARQGKKAADRLILDDRTLAFPRSVRVRSRADYLKIQRSGRKMGGRYIIILSMENEQPASRFGITVSKKTGNAVTRNRVKRRIRELQRQSRSSVVPGKDIVVIATREAPGASFEGMKTEFEDLMNKAGLMLESPEK